MACRVDEQDACMVADVSGHFNSLKHQVAIEKYCKPDKKLANQKNIPIVLQTFGTFRETECKELNDLLLGSLITSNGRDQLSTKKVPPSPLSSKLSNIQTFFGMAENVIPRAFQKMKSFFDRSKFYES